MQFCKFLNLQLVYVQSLLHVFVLNAVFNMFISFVFQVRLFDIGSSGFVFTRSLHRQESRVLCLAWYQNGEYIVIGGTDSVVRVVQVSTASCSQTITLDDYKEKSTLVWDVKFINDSSIVTASSLGRVQVWDFKHGTLQNTFNQHSADVLTLAVQAGDSGDATVFASGVDSKIVQMCRISAERDETSEGLEWKWILSVQSRLHQHDVFSLHISPTGMLASGGMEGELVITDTSSCSKPAYVRYQPFPCMARHFKLAQNGSVLMYQGISAISVWHISTSHVVSSNITHPSDGTKRRKKSCTIQVGPDQAVTEADLSAEQPTPLCLLDLKAKPPHNILSSAISQDGSLIAVSNAYEMWIYRFNATSLRLLLVSHLPHPSFSMQFSKSQLFIASTTEGLKRVTFDKREHVTVDFVVKNKKSVIKHLELSENGKYLAAITTHWRVIVYDTLTGTLVAKLPKLQQLPLVLTFNPIKEELLLFAGGESREVFVYDLTDDSFRCLGRVRTGVKGEVYEGRTKFSHPLAVVPVPFEENLFAVYDNDCAMLFRLTSESTKSPAKLVSGKPAKRRRSCDKKLPVQMIKTAPSVLFVGTFGHLESTSQVLGQEAGKGGLLIVERSWKDVLQALPPTLYRKRFGT